MTSAMRTAKVKPLAGVVPGEEIPLDTFNIDMTRSLEGNQAGEDVVVEHELSRQVSELHGIQQVDIDIDAQDQDVDAFNSFVAAQGNVQVPPLPLPRLRPRAESGFSTLEFVLNTNASSATNTKSATSATNVPGTVQHGPDDDSDLIAAIGTIPTSWEDAINAANTANTAAAAAADPVIGNAPEDEFQPETDSMEQNARLSQAKMMAEEEEIERAFWLQLKAEQTEF